MQCVFVRRRSERACPTQMIYSFATSPPLVYFHHQVLQEKEEEAAKGMGRLTVGGEEMTWEGGEVANMVGGVI